MFCSDAFLFLDKRQSPIHTAISLMCHFFC